MKISHFCTTGPWGGPHTELPSSWGDPIEWTGYIG